MRIPTCLALPLTAGLMAWPTAATTQIVLPRPPDNRLVRPPAIRLGPEIVVAPYALERRGDWHTSYRNWQPVKLYVVDGRYYRTRVRGARPVVVYVHENEYFLPPHEKAWVGFDRRYDYRRQPSGEDWARVRPRQ